MSVFRQAIRGTDGLVDVGYLALFWGLIGWSVGVVFIVCVSTYAIWRVQSPEKASEIITSAGLAIASVSGGFATMLGAVGLFRAGDKEKHPQPPVVTTTTVSPAPTTTVTKTEDDKP